jgi:hypothetical protein
VRIGARPYDSRSHRATLRNVARRSTVPTREQGGEPPNKRMQLTKLRAAPVWQAEVPPCAPAGQTDGGTASQLIRSVRRTCPSSSGAGRMSAVRSSR